jgi:hypothetical protein
VNLIDRYVNETIGGLPEEKRQEAAQELRSRIDRMLPQNPSEQDVVNTLDKIKSSSRPKMEFFRTKKYLIGPDLFDSYIVILKLVLIVVAAVVASTVLFSWIIKPNFQGGVVSMTVDVIKKVAVAVMQGIAQSFLWVTLVFVVMDRSGIKKEKLYIVTKALPQEDLGDTEKKEKGIIHRGEVFFAMFGTIFFTALLYFKPQLIAWYAKDDAGVTAGTPLLNIDRLSSYIPVVIMFAVVSFAILFWKLFVLHWKVSLATANLLYNTAVSIFLFIAVRDLSLYNEDFILNFAELFQITLPEMLQYWGKGTFVFALVFVVANIWDSVDGFLKCRR